MWWVAAAGGVRVASVHGLSVHGDACSRLVQGGQAEYRRVRVPHHRYTPLREEWSTIVGYIVEHMKLQVRMNTKLRTVELKVRPGLSRAGRPTARARVCTPARVFDP